ncbi:hypothetical protein RI367_000320 [Sorochytrium milnesiophthora]
MLKSKASDYSLFDSPARTEKPHVSFASETDTILENQKVRLAARIFQGVSAGLNLVLLSRFSYEFVAQRSLGSAWSGTYWLQYASILTAACMIGYHFVPMIKKKWTFSREMAGEITVDGCFLLFHIISFISLLVASGSCPPGTFGCDLFNWSIVFCTISSAMWAFMLIYDVRDLRRGLAGPEGPHLSLSTLRRMNDSR